MFRKFMPLVLAVVTVSLFAVPAFADDCGGGTCPIHHGGK
jgi:hypothetical protein